MGESMDEMMRNVQSAVESTLSPIQHHIYFDLQRSFYECGLNCFNNKKASQTDIQNCLQRCQVPVQKAQRLVENEMARFQERLERSFLTCRDKIEDFENKYDEDTKLKQMEQCMAVSLKEHLRSLPYIASKLESQMKGVA